MRAYELGNPDLDQRIKELVTDAGDGANSDLVSEMVVTSLKMLRDEANRGELKLVNTALKEMRYSFRVFSGYRNTRKVSIFGSARTTADHPHYSLAADFARTMTEQRGWMVITGAGPGIMEAGNQGAGRERSFGVNIRLPFEAEANPHIPPSRLINFKYFFTRKLIFVKESDAFALFPGGFGTMDEAFETLTLIQTGKTEMSPVMLIEEPGSRYWETWSRFVEDDLLGNGMVAPDDLKLFTICHDVDEAADVACRFYANYHSQRYVDGKLVLRMRRAPDAATIERLNDAYRDIVAEGVIAAVAPTEAEARDHDLLDLERISFTFDRRHFGRLRRLIDELNDIPVPPG